MLRSTKFLGTMAAVLALILMVAAGCTRPLYSKSVTTTYDGNGKLISVVEEEKIVQEDPWDKPMKVRLDQRNRLMD